MTELPRDPRLESTLALLREGYAFIWRRCRQLGTDAFETRLLLQRTICLHGEDAARLFYDDRRFMRKGAAPVRVSKTLLGHGGVQSLDGAAHRTRKRMFMSLTSEERLQELADIAGEEWLDAVDRWTGQKRVVLLPEVEVLLCRAACRWAGVPLPEADVRVRTADLHALIDGAGAIGLRHLRARRARRRAERWLAQLVDEVRDGKLFPSVESALHVIAHHRDARGDHLTSEIAAVELLNVLRPIVAIAYFVTFAALALHEHPEARPGAPDGDPKQLERFVHEVRRYYPLFPFVVARVRDDFHWRGFEFKRGRRVLLDIYGTDHDPRTWADPLVFRPDRFRHYRGGAFNFIPQGGGDPRVDHRCAGERITIELLKVAVAFLSSGIRYRVPPQDLTVDLGRMPALPRSRFVISDVRPRGQREQALPGMVPAPLGNGAERRRSL